MEKLGIRLERATDDQERLVLYREAWSEAASPADREAILDLLVHVNRPLQISQLQAWYPSVADTADGYQLVQRMVKTCPCDCAEFFRNTVSRDRYSPPQPTDGREIYILGTADLKGTAELNCAAKRSAGNR